jgi:2-keto-4-pentenoate hydratase/2-oxohepta-3-ene-1,7-dioic acid hydratase in catechol pathway
MKLARYRDTSGDHWGEIDPAAGTIRRIPDAFTEWAPEVTAKGPGVLRFAGGTLKVDAVKLLAPLHPAGHIYWLGLNYPNWPKPETADASVFFKTRTAVVGPEETIRFPKLIIVQPHAYFVYEIELVAVIGGRTLADPTHGISDVLGYTIGNSGALRNNRVTCVGYDIMGRSSGRSSSAIGPWIVTRDELGGDRHPDLEMTMRINGATRQQGRTGKMIWDMNKLLYEVDYRSKLGCGDVIETGTCGYVGVQDGLYNASDRAEAEIEGIGVLRNTVESKDPYSIHPSQRQLGAANSPPFYPYPVPDEVLR